MSLSSKSFGVVISILSLAFAANHAGATQANADADDGLISRLVDDSKQASDLSFPSSATSKPDGFRSLMDGLFKPEGNGPFPALVVLHDCGGVANYLQTLATRALSEGYVVFIPNSMRGARSNCFRAPPVRAGRRVKDALDAAKNVAALPYVNPQRIFAIGFSQGGTFSNLIVSKSVAAALSPGGARFAAAVSNYPACKVEGGPSRIAHCWCYWSHKTKKRLRLGAMNRSSKPLPTACQLRPSYFPRQPMPGTSPSRAVIPSTIGRAIQSPTITTKRSPTTRGRGLFPSSRRNSSAGSATTAGRAFAVALIT